MDESIMKSNKCRYIRVKTRSRYRLQVQQDNRCEL